MQAGFGKFLGIFAGSDKVAVTRFAPSPTGELHLGHAYAALFAKKAAGPHGVFILRIEDIDLGRCRPAFVSGIEEDLLWLGLNWTKPVRFQSEHLDEYEAALARLNSGGLTYPCFCTRRNLRDFGDALSASHRSSPVYPGTCRKLSESDRRARIEQGLPYAVRLDVTKAMKETGPLTWRDLAHGWIQADPALLGDVVLARKDTPASYHLAVTWDDAIQGIDIVTRAEDLFVATHIHRLLQALLVLPVPVWRHHQLLKDKNGKRFAKRDRALTLRAMREAGKSADEIRSLAGFPGETGSQPC